MNVDGNVADSLHSVSMKNHIIPFADFGNLPNRLNSADFIVGIHNGDQAGIIPDGCLQFLRPYKTVFMNIQQGDGEPFRFQPLQGVQNRMMLKGAGNDMSFSILPALLSGGPDRLIIRLAAAGSKNDLFGPSE